MDFYDDEQPRRIIRSWDNMMINLVEIVSDRAMLMRAVRVKYTELYNRYCTVNEGFLEIQKTVQNMHTIKVTMERTKVAWALKKEKLEVEEEIISPAKKIRMDPPDEEKPSTSAEVPEPKKADKRKIKRSWDNMMRTLGDNVSDIAKLQAVKVKYTELYTEYCSINDKLKTTDKIVKTLQKEYEQSRSENNKNIVARMKIESVARELQKQNREIKEESQNRLKIEEEKRKEVALKFTEKLNTLTQLMDENKDKSNNLRDENINMTVKLSELYDQFQQRESHLLNMDKQMELQKQLFETQIKKLEYQLMQEREISRSEKTILLANLDKSENTNKVLQDNVKSLQEHLDSYQKQYTDFESTMKRSNKVFDSFKEEMTKMQKTNSALEKDRNEWHARWKGTTHKLFQLNELHQTTSNELQTVKKKMDALEKLCRKLQLERSYYLQQLKQHNIQPNAPDDGVHPSTSGDTNTNHIESEVSKCKIEDNYSSESDDIFEEGASVKSRNEQPSSEVEANSESASDSSQKIIVTTNINNAKGKDKWEPEDVRNCSQETFMVTTVNVIEDNTSDAIVEIADVLEEAVVTTIPRDNASIPWEDVPTTRANNPTNEEGDKTAESADKPDDNCDAV